MTDNFDEVYLSLSPARRQAIRSEMEKRVIEENKFRNDLIREAGEAKLSNLYSSMLNNASEAQGGLPLNPHQKALLYSQARQALGFPND